MIKLLDRKSVLNLSAKIAFFAFLFCFLSLIFYINTSRAAAPTNISYQGYLTNSSNTPQSGSMAMTIRIYDHLSTGSLLFEEIHPSITVSNGFFSIPVGTVGDVNGTTTASSLDQLPYDNNYFMSLEIPSLSTGQMSPRSAINAVAFSYTAYGLIAQSAQPSNPNKGQLFFDTDDNTIYFYNGTIWSSLGGAVTSNSIDFDEFVASASLDTNLDIALNTKQIDIGNGIFKIATSSNGYNVTTNSGISINGGRVQTTSVSFDFNVPNTGVFRFRDGTNNLVSILDLGTTASIYDNGNLEVTGYASINQIFLAGQNLIPLTSNSIDFDEIKASTTLDENLDISLAGKRLDIGNGVLVIATSSNNLNITTNGSIAINGGKLQTSSLSFDFNVASAGNFRFRDGTNTLISILDLGTTASLYDNGNLEVTGYASVSDLFVNGSRLRLVTSNSLDFDEIVASMTLDTNTDVALSGKVLDFGNGMLVLSTQSDGFNLRVNGGLALNGGKIGTSSVSFDINVADSGNFRFRDDTNTLVSILDLGSIASLYMKGNLEATGYASVAGIFVNGAPLSPLSSNTIDFDEIVASMTLDTNTDIALNSKRLDIGNGVLVIATSSNNLNITTNGSIAVNGGKLQTSSLSFDFNVANTGNFRFRDGTNTLISILDLGTTASLYDNGNLEVTGIASFSRVLSNLSLQAAGIVSASYSRYGNNFTSHPNYITQANDLLISGDLEVDGSATFDGPVSISRKFTINNNIRLQGAGNRLFFSDGTSIGSAASLAVGAISSADVNISADTDAANGGSINFLTSTITRMIISSAGNVGIGDLTPEAQFEVAVNASMSSLTIGNFASLSSNLEIATYVSTSTLYIAGNKIKSYSSNSIDFDEIVSSATLDTNWDIALNGKQIDFGSGALVIANTASGYHLSSNKTLAVDGGKIQTASLTFDFNISSLGSITFGDGSNKLLTFKDLGTTASAYNRGNLEVTNYVSVSQLYLKSVLFKSPASNSINFDEFVASMNLDTNTDIRLNTRRIDLNNGLFVIATSSGNSNLHLTTNSNLAVNGGKITTASANFEFNVANGGRERFFGAGSGFLSITDLGTTASLYDRGNLEVTGYASVSSLRVGGLAFKAIASNSINFDEVVASMNLYTNVDIKLNGRTLDFGNGVLLLATQSNGFNVRTSGGISIAGGQVSTASSAMEFQMNNTGKLRFRDGTNALLTITDMGTTGSAFLNGSLELSGYASITSSLGLSLSPTNTTTVNILKFFELSANGANSFGLRASNSIAGNVTWTLPGSDGTASQSLATDGAGTLYWRDVGYVPPIQDNNGTAFKLAEGNNNYIIADTTNFAENLTIGNTTNNQQIFFLGSGSATFSAAILPNGSDQVNGSQNLGTTGKYFTNVYSAKMFGNVLTVANFDIAESYELADSTISAGDVVAINNEGKIVKANSNEAITTVGVVSTKPGLLLSEWDESTSHTPIALAGRVPVKIDPSINKEEIKSGDELTPSKDNPGTAVKAKPGDKIIGIVLSVSNDQTPSTSSGQVMMMVKNGIASNNDTILTSKDLIDPNNTSPLSNTASSSEDSLPTQFFKSLTKKLIAWLGDAGNGISNLSANKIKTDKLCLKDGSAEKNCYTGDELEQMLQSQP